MSEFRVVISSRRSDLSHELGRLRREAAERYTEVDLLVAAMREHIDDLRRERDRLVIELDEHGQKVVDHISAEALQNESAGRAKRKAA